MKTGLFPMIRMLNLHNTPHARSDELDYLISDCSRKYISVTPDILEKYCITGEWMYSKPGLVLACYNGYRNNYDVAARIFDKYQMTAWIYVATDFVTAPADEQHGFCLSHNMKCLNDEYTDSRLALSPEELLELSKKHEISSHTSSHHVILGQNSTDYEFGHEIVDSAEQIKEWTGRSPAGFCWLLGEDYASCPKAHPYFKSAEYRFLFGSRSIEYLL